MVSDVMLADPEDAGPAPEKPRSRPFRRTNRTDLGRVVRWPGAVTAAVLRHGRVTRVVLLAVGCLFSALCLLVLFATWRDDVSIDAHLGRADADVLSVAFNRTAIRFVTAGGTVELPPNGVLYPSGLAAGERVRVEYDRADPELVRVSGRDYTLAFLPVGLALLITWAVLGPVLWLLRRRSATSRTPRR